MCCVCMLGFNMLVTAHGILKKQVKAKLPS